MTQIYEPKIGIEKAIDVIKNDGIVVFPTETVYGLGANAFSETAVAKIFKAKGRPQDNPLIVHISELGAVSKIAKNVPKAFFMLAEKFMPGALTIVLEKSDNIPDIVTAGGNTVAVRMPNHKIALELIKNSCPLAAPSANKSKHISPTTAEHVYEDLVGELDVIIDGGDCSVGIESTVLDLTTDVPTILRPGAVTAQMIADTIGEVLQNGKVIKVAKSPGMKYQHYAPKCDAVQANSALSAIAEYDRCAESKNPVILGLDDFCAEVGQRNTLSLGANAQEYMASVYNALHTAERNFDYIIIQKLYGDGIEDSIMNRVSKATGGREV